MAKTPDKQPDREETAKRSGRKPRVRKVETIRERNVKAVAKAEAKATKQPKRRRATGLLAKIFRPFKKPLYTLAWPFRLRPVRFIGRILGRILWPKYFRNSWQEIRQVTWPSRSETWKLTIAVLIFALIFGLATAGTDWVLDKVIRRLVFRA